MSRVPDTIECDAFVLRPWRLDDREALVKHATNRKIWRNLFDGFPHPYTLEDADRFITGNLPGRGNEVCFAIDVGEPVGTISYNPGGDQHRFSAEIGYWLSESYWGKGIMTRAVKVLSDVIFQHTDIARLYAPVFAWNPASMRVLEKAGFEREGILRRSLFKDGRLIDRVLYAKTRETDLPYDAFEG